MLAFLHTGLALAFLVIAMFMGLALVGIPGLWLVNKGACARKRYPNALGRAFGWAIQLAGLALIGHIVWLVIDALMGFSAPSGAALPQEGVAYAVALIVWGLLNVFLWLNIFAFVRTIARLTIQARRLKKLKNDPANTL